MERSSFKILILYLLFFVLVLLGQQRCYSSSKQFPSSLPTTIHDNAFRAYEEGYEHYRWGRFVEAEKKLKEAISLEPNLVKAHYWLGKLYREMGKLKEAIFHEEEVLRLNRLLRERRIALSVKNNEYPALEQIQKLKEQEKNAQIAFERGLHFQREGHWDAAVAEFKAAVVLYPGNPEYLLKLARILWDQKDFLGSAKFYGELLDLQPVDQNILLEGIDRLILSGNIARAKAYLRFFQKKHPNWIEIAKRLSSLQDENEELIVPAIGKVVEKMKGQVVLDFGLEQGLKLADEYTLELRTFRPGKLITHPDNGKVIGRIPDEITGNLLVAKIFPKSCWAIIQQEFGSGIRIGDLVEIKAVPRSR